MTIGSGSGSFSATVTASAQVAEINTREFTTLFVSFIVGVADLSAFTVEYKVDPNSTQYASIASVAADYTSPEGVVLGASSDLTIAAAGATVQFLMLDVRGVQAVRLKAAGTASTVTGYYGMN